MKKSVLIFSFTILSFNVATMNEAIEPVTAIASVALSIQVLKGTCWGIRYLKECISPNEEQKVEKLEKEKAKRKSLAERVKEKIGKG